MNTPTQMPEVKYKKEHFSFPWKKYIRLLGAFALMLLVFTQVSLSAQAYSAPGWTRVGEGFYRDNASATEEAVVEEEEEDSIIKHMNKLSIWVNEKVEGTMSKNGTFNTDITGVVMGRAGGYDISIGKFELYEENPYGIMGAKVYVVLRNAMYLFLVVQLIIAATKNALHSGSKNRAELKEDIYTTIILMGIIYFIPALYNLFTIGRDILQDAIANSFTGFNGYTQYNASGLDAILSVLDAANGNFIYITVRLAYLLAGWFYLGNYVLNALISMGIFMLLPVVAVLSFKNHKMMEGWIIKLFTNALIPFIDYIFLLAPIFLHQMISSSLSSPGLKFTFAIVTVITIWSIIPARSAILNALGNNLGGARAGGGFGALALMAMRGLGGLGRSAGGSGGASQGTGGILNDLSNAERFRGMEQDLNRSMESTKMSMDALQANNNLFALDDNKETYMRSLLSEDKVALEGERDFLKEIEASEDAYDKDIFAAEMRDDFRERDPLGTEALDEINELERVASSEGVEDFSALEQDGRADVLEGGDINTFSNIDSSDIGDSAMDTKPTMTQEEMDAAALEEKRIEEQRLQDAYDYNESNRYDGDELYGGKRFDEAALEEKRIEEQRLQDAYDYIESGRYDGDELYGGKRFDELEQGQQFDKLRYENLKEMDTADRMIRDYDEQIAKQDKKIIEAQNNAIATKDEDIAPIQASIDKDRDSVRQMQEQINRAQTTLEAQYPGGEPLGSNFSEQDRTYYSDTKQFINDKNVEIDKLNKQISTSEQKIEQLKSSAVSESREYREATEQKAKLIENKKKAQNIYDQRQGFEQEFANKNQVYRGDGKVFENAGAFKDTMEHNEVIRKQASYRNFDSSPSAGVLSPEAKAKHAQNRALHTGVKMALNTVARPTAMAIGAVAMAAGGQQASMMGAMAGSMALDKAETTVEQAADYYRARGAYNYSDDDKQAHKTNVEVERNWVEQDYTNRLIQRKPVKEKTSVEQKQEPQILISAPRGFTPEDMERAIKMSTPKE